MFIGGLNWDTTDEGLRAYFEQFGNVDACTIMRDQAGRSRCFAFLTFEDPASVNAVMVKEHVLDGKIIDPKRAIPRQEHQRATKLFIGGLAGTVTSESMRAFFSQFGRVIDSTVMLDRDTGRSKGFGFVSLEDSNIQQYLGFGNLEIDGKLIDIKLAQPRYQREHFQEDQPSGSDGFNNRATGFSSTTNLQSGGNPAGNFSAGAAGASSGSPFDPSALAALYTRMFQMANVANGAMNPMMTGMNPMVAMRNNMMAGGTGMQGGAGMGNMAGGAGMGMGRGGMPGGSGGQNIPRGPRGNSNSAGLVYKHFGKEIISNETNLPVDHDNVQILWLKLYREFIEAIDAIDNGISQYDASEIKARYRVRTDLSARVAHLNPPWNKSLAAQDMDAQFEKASTLTGSEFLARLDYYSNAWLPARELLVAAIQRSKNEIDSSGRIILLESFLPWKEHLFDLESETTTMNSAATYVIYPDDNSGDWRVQAVSVEPESFESRKALPEKWRGLRDDVLSERTGIAGGVFVHASGFIGGNRTKDGALQMAKIALEL
ncbi:hypothetical protein D9757_002911 [Collybiopsis confluens]|uniref:RRM domain-containing protein n=1 Tax=Collybiopsis confluens TaxID=2823264 RepID=A0A8H5HW32_9AGAR|nr:hypothetical protein D9757_002911 [Collybiopsis confluens]